MFKIFEKYLNLIAAISEKKDGSMKIFADKSELHEISENRRGFLKNNSIEIEKSIGAYLCHGKNVEKVSAEDRSMIFENIDGLLTKEKEVFLTVTIADCLAIFLYDKKREIISLLHAGWKGLRENIIKEAILKMKSEGSLPEDILVGIGPAIGFCHYEVGEDVAEKFSRFGSEVVKKENGKIFLDLKRIAKLQLIENGVILENIEINPECTFCEKQKYFSFRRDANGDLKKLEAMMAVFGIRK